MVQQQEPNTYDKQLVALGRVLQTLREEEDSDVLIETVISFLKSEFAYSLIWVGLYDRLEHRLLGKGGVAPLPDAAFLKQRFTLNPGDVLEQVVIQQRPMAIPDLREELRAGEWRKAAQKYSIQGTVIFPIRYRDRCYGVALMGSPHWGISPKSDEKARLSMILGEFAASLFKIETEWQRQQTKHPDEPLLNLLTQMRSLSGLGPRLEAVVEETHQFIEPTRTSIYWYERERRYFWRRLGNRQRTTGFGEANQPASGITAQEVNGFYQALLADQVVSIGEAHSSLKADITSRLMQQIRARSLLAAPILFQDELLGFLAVEGNEPRIWTEHEKHFIRGAAQMISLVAPLNEMESTIEQVQHDRQLTAEIARAIYDETDWKTTVKHAADQLCKRLKAERFLMLVYDPNQQNFETCYQSQPSNRRPLHGLLPPLSEIDRRLLETSEVAIGIENLDGDLKLVAWRDRLLELGIKSLLVCNMASGHPLEGVLVIGHEAPRSWTRLELDLVRVVSQQLGFILHQWQLQRQMEQHQQLQHTTQTGLQALQQIHHLDKLEETALKHVVSVLQAPLAVMVKWIPGQTVGTIATSPIPSDRFKVDTEARIAIQQDPLVQWAIATPDILSCSGADIPAQSRQWLIGKGIGQILVMALRTAGHHWPSGVIIVADEPGRHWRDRHLVAFETLVNQIAWTRRHLILVEQLTTRQLELERLAWYKHRRLEETHRLLHAGLSRLDELGNLKDPLLVTRQQQLLRQLKDAIAPLPQVLATESWQLQTTTNAISLISLLKRALERVDERIQKGQLWTQVHDETNLTISGDIPKIELVLYELLRLACERSPVGSRIDLWCRQIDSRWFELCITDQGSVDPELFTDLTSDRVDWLEPTLLDSPPGLHLLICQSLMANLGGEFNFYKLEDGRNTSRLVLPLAVNNSGDRSTNLRTTG